QEALLRDLLVAHLDHELRLHPSVSGPTRKRPDAGRLGQPQRLHLGARGRQLLLAEAAAHLSDVDETLRLAHRDVDRAEPSAGALGPGEAHHREVADAVDADLLPVA